MEVSAQASGALPISSLPKPSTGSRIAPARKMTQICTSVSRKTGSILPSSSSQRRSGAESSRRRLPDLRSSKMLRATAEAARKTNSTVIPGTMEEPRLNSTFSASSCRGSVCRMEISGDWRDWSNCVFACASTRLGSKMVCTWGFAACIAFICSIPSRICNSSESPPAIPLTMRRTVWLALVSELGWRIMPRVTGLPSANAWLNPSGMTR